MGVDSISASNAAMAATVRQMQQIQQMQMAIMKSIAESQQQLAEMVQVSGIGTNINVSA